MDWKYIINNVICEGILIENSATTDKTSRMNSRNKKVYFCLSEWMGWLGLSLLWVMGAVPHLRQRIPFHSISLNSISACLAVHQLMKRKRDWVYFFIKERWKSWLNWNVVGVELGQQPHNQQPAAHEMERRGSTTIPLHSIQPNPTKEK